MLAKGVTVTTATTAELRAAVQAAARGWDESEPDKPSVALDTELIAAAVAVLSRRSKGVRMRLRA